MPLLQIKASTFQQKAITDEKVSVYKQFDVMKSDQEVEEQNKHLVCMEEYDIV